MSYNCPYCNEWFEDSVKKQKHKIRKHTEKCKKDFSPEGFTHLILDFGTKKLKEKYADHIRKNPDTRVR